MTPFNIFRSAVNLEDKPIAMGDIIAPGAFAGWFSGELLIRSGDELWSDDDNGFMESEFETVYIVRNGCVIGRQHYVCQSDNTGKIVRRPQKIAPKTPIFICNTPQQ